MLIVLPGTGLFFRISSLIAFLHITSGMLWLSGEACRLSRVEVLTHSGSGVREEIGQVAFSCTDFFFFFFLKSGLNKSLYNNVTRMKSKGWILLLLLVEQRERAFRVDISV